MAEAEEALQVAHEVEPQQELELPRTDEDLPPQGPEPAPNEDLEGPPTAPPSQEQRKAGEDQGTLSLQMTREDLQTWLIQTNHRRAKLELDRLKRKKARQKKK